MKSRSLGIRGTLGRYAATLGVIVSLAGCATARAPREDLANLKTETASAQLPSNRVRNWTALNDQTLIVESVDGARYKAEMAGPCIGLAQTVNLGFYNHGGFNQIDRFSSVVLPDGSRCPLATFNKVISPEASALDEYEKGIAEEEKKKQAEQGKTDASPPNPENSSAAPR
jgi:Family of unknown function (DUF6491)